MANPNLTTLTAATAAVLAEGQLGTSATDFTVPTGKAWKPAGGTVCNTSASPATVTISALSSSGGTARKLVSAYSLSPGDTLDLTAYLPKMLPEAAILRASAGTAAVLDLVITGTVLG